MQACLDHYNARHKPYVWSAAAATFLEKAAMGEKRYSWHTRASRVEVKGATPRGAGMARAVLTVACRGG